MGNVLIQTGHHLETLTGEIKNLGIKTNKMNVQVKQLNENFLYDFVDLLEASLWTKVLRRKHRLSVLSLLIQHGEMSVTSLFVSLRAGQPEVSQALKDLRDLGLVNCRKAGKIRMYSINNERVNTLIKLLKEMEKRAK